MTVLVYRVQKGWSFLPESGSVDDLHAVNVPDNARFRDVRLRTTERLLFIPSKADPVISLGWTANDLMKEVLRGGNRIRFAEFAHN